MPKKEARDKIRRETGSVAIMETKDGPKAADPRVMQTREAALKVFKKAREG